MWLYATVIYLAWRFTRLHEYVSYAMEQYITPVVEPMVRPWIEQYLACYLNQYWTFHEKNIAPRIEHAMLACQVVKGVLWIYFCNWMNLCGICDSSTSGIRWLYYTYDGQRYKMPLSRRMRGPSAADPELDRVFGFEVRGPYGDYHGQQELLREMVVSESTVNAH